MTFAFLFSFIYLFTTAYVDTVYTFIISGEVPGVLKRGCGTLL